ncbi:hypothetical protein KQX54_011901 [Cotesia glomerata]|uniref:BEN domain-containing protein n=1 Tax=Cotesia glomerata TaxID=32391 RepID=A0AAV7HV16_COTGL|nr:hypothetical protein KQX54_011901 [Cotesia glomerata]
MFEHSLVKLNKKLKAIDGIQSPKRCVAHEVTEESGPSKNDIPEKNEKATVNEPEVVVCDTEIDKSPKVKRKKLFDDKEIEILNDGKSKTTESLSPPSVNDGEFKDSDVEIIKGKDVKPSGTSEFVTKQELSEAITMAVNKILSAMPSTSSATSTLRANPSKTKHTQKKKNDMVESGEPGRNIFVTADQWRAAESATTFTAMTTSLLVSVFSTDELIKCNYKGGAPKNSKDKSIVHSGLENTDKLKAIKETVNNRFKRQFNNTEFGKCINVKCNKLRSLHNTSKRELETKSTQEKKEEDENKKE